MVHSSWNACCTFEIERPVGRLNASYSRVFEALRPRGLLLVSPSAKRETPLLDFG